MITEELDRSEDEEDHPSYRVDEDLELSVKRSLRISEDDRDSPVSVMSGGKTTIHSWETPSYAEVIDEVNHRISSLRWLQFVTT